MTPAVIGVDPGGRTTGVVARVAGQLLAADLVTRDGPELFPDAAYLDEVVTAIGGLVVYAECDRGRAVIAVEGVVHPSGHVRMINAAGLLGTACVLGAVLAHFPGAVVVAPAKHGVGPRNAYPAQLWPPGEQKGTGRRRHVRSAWDIAGAGAVMTRLSTEMGCS